MPELEGQRGYHVTIDVDDIEGFIDAMSAMLANVVDKIASNQRMLLELQLKSAAKQQQQSSTPAVQEGFTQVPTAVWDKLQRLARSGKPRVKNLSALEMIALIKQTK